MATCTDPLEIFDPDVYVNWNLQPLKAFYIYKTLLLRRAVRPCKLYINQYIISDIQPPPNSQSISWCIEKYAQLETWESYGQGLWDNTVSGPIKHYGPFGIWKEFVCQGLTIHHAVLVPKINGSVCSQFQQSWLRLSGKAV